MRTMTIEEFNSLDEGSKLVILFEAENVSEKKDEFTKYQLFMVYDFFTETSISINNAWKRTIATYSFENVPVNYVGDVQAKLLEKYKY